MMSLNFGEEEMELMRRKGKSMREKKGRLSI